jgi:hypothetical protein
VSADLLRGAIDLHVHPAPSPYPRRIDAVGAAQAAAAAGMRGIALKSHHSDTAMLIAAVADHGLAELDVEVYGGIALNSQVGGINPHAVALSLAMGGRIVWLPTISSPAHIASHAHFPTATVDLIDERPVDVWGPDGLLLAELEQVIELVAHNDAVLASGHLPAHSIRATFEAAHAAGVQRLLVNHPNYIVDLTAAETESLVELGAYVEHEVALFDETTRFCAFDTETLERWIEVAGVERTIPASDLGQAGNPLPSESLARVGERLVRGGRSEDDVRQMLAVNPARLLGIDTPPPT